MNTNHLTRPVDGGSDTESVHYAERDVSGKMRCSHLICLQYSRLLLPLDMSDHYTPTVINNTFKTHLSGFIQGLWAGGAKDLVTICQLSFFLFHRAPLPSSLSGQSRLIYGALAPLVLPRDSLRAHFIKVERFTHLVRAHTCRGRLTKVGQEPLHAATVCLRLHVYCLTSLFIMMDMPILRQSKQRLYCIVTLSAF